MKDGFTPVTDGLDLSAPKERRPKRLHIPNICHTLGIPGDAQGGRTGLYYTWINHVRGSINHVGEVCISFVDHSTHLRFNYGLTKV